MKQPIEEGYQRVWPMPDTEPVVMDKPRCLYASWPWLTEDFIREVAADG
ncbi:hypothetical protein ACQEVG_32920 [Streptomyces sp. CA-135486]